MSTAAVTFNGVTRVHGTGEAQVVALQDVSFEVKPGELVAIMGPSGSGKSTLLNLAGALDTPTSGTVSIQGAETTSMSKNEVAAVRRRHAGFVFQDLNLIPSLTAAENVALPLELDGVATKDARAAALTCLDRVGVPELADRFPENMSGGQQQRVAIARALVGTRSLLLADEPTGALDSVTGDAILATLRELCDSGVAGLLVTHESRHAAWADRVIFLRDGRIVDSTAA